MQKGIDYIGVGVGAVIVNEAGEYFLARRGPEARNERNRWEFPGGAVEFGETMAVALVREVKEEYGFDISVVRLLDVVDHLIPEEHQHWISPTFLCTYVQGTPRIMEPRKCTEIGWFSLSSISQLDLSAASRSSLRSLRSALADCGGPPARRQKVAALLLLGPTGAGKSPLGDAIAARGIFSKPALHLDFGAELRSLAAGGVAAESYSAQELDFIHGVLEDGLLLENEHFFLAEKIIRLFLTRHGCTDRHLLVLNGIPRHIGQAQDMERIASVGSLCLLECSADSVHCRLNSNVGGDRTERTDEDRVLVGKKLKIFNERTAPLIDYYKNKNCTVYRLTISDSSTADDAYRQLSSLAAVDPPVTLVAEPPER